MYYLDTDNFGRICIKVNSRASRMIARWTDGTLVVTVPPCLSGNHVRQFLAEHEQNIRNLRYAEVHFWVGQVLRCYGCSITIGEQNLRPNQIITSMPKIDMRLNVPTGCDMEQSHVKHVISLAISRLLQSVAPKLLLQHASEVASRVGAKPSNWKVSRGLRRLGYCSKNGEIALSCSIMMLPLDLMDLVICHELAHLTHFDHSPAFHALVDSYVGGGEKELERQLREFNWPITK